VPLKRFFPFVHRLVPAAGDFASGKEIVQLKLPDLSVGILICYEAIFPELARTHVEKGAKILVNLTNDAWFGMTSAPYQHLCMSAFRAVENGRPLIRAANTGFSAFIGSNGRIIAQSDLFTEAVLKHEVMVNGPARTFYTRYGDIFALTILLICLINLFFILCYHRSNCQKQ
jgi:apolipoprotein N-acyltransferase